MDWMLHTPAVRHLHMGLALLSGGLFALRGACVLKGQRWPLHPLLNKASAIIDTALLAAALRLLWMLHLNPLTTQWLQAKLVALVIYIGLGILALRRARHYTVRVWCYFGALLCFLYIVSVAITHSPWGAAVLLQRLG
jgi:uncharacterized membrane protein SirB2